MRLPVPWLKKYVEFFWSPEKLAERLTLSGTAVEAVKHRAGDAVFEIEVTTNRPDCLSVWGLAWEVSALTGKTPRFPKVSAEIPKTSGKKSEAPKPVIRVEDKKGCPRYTARVMRHVKIAETPESYRNLLGLMDSRPVSNAVDATNFVLFETGQPLHAFDYDRINGNVVVVRRARPGEKFLGLDGVEYTLDADTLVIADAEKPIAMAGVIGGKLTEVTSETKNILLESACFDPHAVRRASRRYKIITESSHRFERGVDPDLVDLASARARDLMVSWAGGQDAFGLLESGALKKSARRKLTLRTSRVDSLLGISIAPARMLAILKKLGFAVKMSSRTKLEVTVPGRRRDVAQEADLIEEILRIEGFEKVPASIPVTRHPDNPLSDRKAEGILELKKFLAASGFQEIITHSLLPSKALTDSGFRDLASVQKIRNALSAEQEYFRPSLFPGMLGAVLFNVHRKASALKLFEIGNRNLEGREETVLGLAVTGNFLDNWRIKTEASYADVKGVLENVLRFLQVKGYEWQPVSNPALFENLNALTVSTRPLAGLGVVSQEVLRRWDIPCDVIFAEMVLDTVAAGAVEGPSFKVKPLPKFPSVRRDVAFVIDAEIPVRNLEETMRKAAAPFLEEVVLFDEYTGKNIPGNKRSLAFSLQYQKETGTFTDAEIQELQQIGRASCRERV